LEKRRTEIFDEDYLPKSEAFPKVRELIERIKKDGKKSCWRRAPRKSNWNFSKRQ
jgi:hypothetical protein